MRDEKKMVMVDKKRRETKGNEKGVRNGGL